MNGFFLENIQKVSLSGKDWNCDLRSSKSLDLTRHSDCACAPATAGREYSGDQPMIDPWNLVHLNPIFIELDDGKIYRFKPYI